VALGDLLLLGLLVMLGLFAANPAEVSLLRSSLSGGNNLCNPSNPSRSRSPVVKKSHLWHSAERRWSKRARNVKTA